MKIIIIISRFKIKVLLFQGENMDRWCYPTMHLVVLLMVLCGLREQCEGERGAPV